MEKYFVNYAQAVALKELGFDEKCFKYYRSDKEFCNFLNYEVIEFDDTEYITNSISTILWCDKHCAAPLKAQVFEWFREKHNLFLLMQVGGHNGKYQTFYFNIFKFGKNLYNSQFRSQTSVYTYEEAESAVIDKLIELVK